MARKKTELFPRKDVELAEFSRVLSHPARIAILKTLARQNQCMCGELVDALPLAQATVSQHLRELKDIGFITGEVDGPKLSYCIDWAVLEQAAQQFKSLFEELESCKRDECCIITDERNTP